MLLKERNGHFCVLKLEEDVIFDPDVSCKFWDKNCQGWQDLDKDFATQHCFGEKMNDHGQKLNGSGDQLLDDRQPHGRSGKGEEKEEDKKEDEEEERIGWCPECGKLGAGGNLCDSCEDSGFIYKKLWDNKIEGRQNLLKADLLKLHLLKLAGAMTIRYFQT
jgi:hypothetical protein